MGLLQFDDRSGGEQSTIMMAMARIAWNLRIIIALTLLLVAQRGACFASAEDTLVVANTTFEGSVELAQFYAASRGIPPENVIVLSMPTEESITWKEFAEQIFNPLRAELEKRGRLTLLATDFHDSAGRRIDTVISHNIAYLVTCYGVPLRVHADPRIVSADENAHFESTIRNFLPDQSADVLQQNIRAFQTNRSSVDAELTLLASSGRLQTPGFLPNPLFEKPNPSAVQLNRIVRVTRLDGPNEKSVRKLITSALEGEKLGVNGRVYIDEDGRNDGNYALGNAWLKSIAQRASEQGFSVQHDLQRETFPLNARFDAPALYFGWWTQDVAGPFTLNGFRFSPGAIATHIHSFSAETIRQGTGERGARWCGPLVELGAAATLGNTFEPYLHLSHHLDIFYKELVHGKTFGEAAYTALPALSWMAVAIGDPLYRPFKYKPRIVEEAKGNDAAEYSDNPYAIIQSMHRLIGEGRGAEALELGDAGLRRTKHLALGMEVAQILFRDGRHTDARAALTSLQHAEPLSANEWMLSIAIADFAYSQLNDAPLAFYFYRLVMDAPDRNAELTSLLLPKALVIAQAADEFDAVARWQELTNGR